jgi:uncharacterized iron-regulated protein
VHPLRPRTLAAVLLLAGGLASACALLGREQDAASRPAAGLILDARAARYLDEGTLLDRLAGARFALLGERHDHPEHHRLQARVLQGLVDRGRRPAVVFEMLSADVAPELAKALAEPHSTAEALRRAVAWDESGWPPFAIYAPVFEAALRTGLPIATGDLSAAALQQLGHGGLAGLAPGLRASLLADAPLPDAARAALAQDVRTGHCGLLPERLVPRMVDVQASRDAWLARSLADAARGADGAVLISGAGHVRRDWGVPFWLHRREPGARVASLAFVEVEPGQLRPGDEAVLYDYVWYTEPLDTGDPCVIYREQLEKLRSQPAPPR